MRINEIILEHDAVMQKNYNRYPELYFNYPGTLGRNLVAFRKEGDTWVPAHLDAEPYLDIFLDKIQNKDVSEDVGVSSKLYHVTLTSNVSKIMKKGITPMNATNWVKSGDGSRYGGGEIFAMENLVDAIRWAANWDWHKFQETGSGKVSIVTFNDDPDSWEHDESDPLSQMGNDGRWLKKMGAIPADKIKSVIPVTIQVIQKLVQRNNEKFSEAAIKLRKPTDQQYEDVDNFMDELQRKTHPHPFNSRAVIIFGSVELLVHAGLNHIILSSIMTFDRHRQGLATKALEFLKNLADKHDVMISGTIMAYSKSKDHVRSNKKLAQWYKKNGFDVNGSSMVYRPNQS